MSISMSDTLKALIAKNTTSVNSDLSERKQPEKQKYTSNVHIDIQITRSGTYIENTLKLDQNIIKRIKNYYTLHDKQIMGYYKHTSNWKYKENKLYIPRFGSLFLPKKFKTISITSNIRPSNPLYIKYTGIFKGNQELIFNEIMNKWFNEENMLAGKAGLILNLQAGHGKSFLGLALINALQCRTLIVTHNTSKLNEWVKIITEYCPGAKVGKYYGKKKAYGDIVVGVINSLVQDEIKLAGITTPRAFYDSFDFIIFDECHEFCSETRAKIYEVCQTPYMLGLSATPNDRTSDSLDKIVHWGIGPILIADQLEGYTLDNINFTGRVTKINYYGHMDYTEHIINETTEMTSTPLMIGQLCDSPYRLKLIVSLILEQHAKGLNILVFADRRSYLETIRVELDKTGSVKSGILEDITPNGTLSSDTPKDTKINQKMESIRLVGGSTSDDMQKAIDSKNIILSTYQYFGTGISIPKLSAVVLATPRKSKARQFINRIFRLGSNYEIERQIIDIVDTKTSLKTQWYERKKYYDEQGFEMDERKIKWSDFE